MHGFLNFITGTSPEAIDLRRKTVFKIVPMINPDGVIVGNYRTSLSGNDLNR
jgi:cytosolic carboxypeptidase protein 2/3